MTTPDTPPAGYMPHDRHSPMTAPWEPIYARRTDAALQLAVQIREPHCNARGLAHGGLITALADNAMGLSARIVAQAARPADGERHAGALTVSLSIDFVDIARPGDWLEVLPTVVRAGKTLSFDESRIVVGERTIARANATFRMA